MEIVVSDYTTVLDVNKSKKLVAKQNSQHNLPNSNSHLHMHKKVRGQTTLDLMDKVSENETLEDK
jgi:hypothetical protein